MIEKLAEFGNMTLVPDLLSGPDERWNSLILDSKKPHIERLWQKYLEFYIGLHLIHPCETQEADWREHPRPMAMHVVSGSYELVFGNNRYRNHIETDIRQQIFGDFRFEVAGFNSLHYLRPIGEPAMSIEITRLPYAPRIESSPALPAGRVTELLKIWREYYGITKLSRVHRKKKADKPGL